MRTALALVVFVLSWCGAGSAWAQKECQPGEEIAKFSHVVPPQGHPKGDFATALSERVNREMDGSLCMQVFPYSQLYDDEKVMEALLLGDVQLAAPSLAKLEALSARFRVFDLPFIFEDMSAVERFADGPKGQELLGAVSDFGIAGLGYLYDGLKHFSAEVPLIEPKDAEGLKFRVQNSDVAVAMIEAMDASAQKLAFKEVYGALQLGVVDGQENSWSNILTSRFFEVQDSTTETNHQLLGYIVFAPQAWLDELEPDVRTQFLMIFEEVLRVSNAKAAETNRLSREKITEAGHTIRQLTPEQRQKWVDVMQPVWSQFADGIGQDVIDAAVAANQPNASVQPQSD